MSLTKSAIVLSFALTTLSGCDAEPDAGAPRAPLPSEIKASPQPPGPSPSPRSLPEIQKELAAKKAKQEADKAAAEAAASKPSGSTDSPPGAVETTKPAAPATPPKEKAAESAPAKP